MANSSLALARDEIVCVLSRCVMAAAALPPAADDDWWPQPA